MLIFRVQITFSFIAVNSEYTYECHKVCSKITFFFCLMCVQVEFKAIIENSVFSSELQPERSCSKSKWIKHHVLCNFAFTLRPRHL